MAKLPTVNVLSVVGMKTEVIYKVKSETCTYTHKIGGEYMNLRTIAASTYEVDIKKKTCNCEHGKYSNTSDPNFLSCKHIQLAEKIRLESRVKNRIHATLNLKVGEGVVYIKKITPIKNGMIAVSYEINNGTGCCFINPKNLPEEGHFKIRKMVKEDFSAIYIVHRNEEFTAQLELTPQGWRKFTVVDGKKVVSDFCMDFYDTAIALPINRVGYYKILWEPGEKPESVVSKIFLEDQEQINKFRIAFSIFQGV